MKNFQCSACGRRVFFTNLSCVSCGAFLGFDQGQLDMCAFEVVNDRWQRVGMPGAEMMPCTHREDHGCNWMVPADSVSLRCVCCASTHAVPDLHKPGNRQRWRKLEEAKHRLFFSLLSIGLPARDKLSDAEHGLSFQFLEQVAAGELVVTGHANSVITINVAEADDAYREKMRMDMNEPYRTVLGHFRHEVGHHYWDKLIQNTSRVDAFRRLFGDERADYAEALKRHYATPAENWRLRYVSSYASSHPWEDWAECWAHYLHIRDSLETAAEWGLRLDRALPGGAALTPSRLCNDALSIQPVLIQEWLPLSQFVNAMDRSLGSNDSYPFIMPTPVLEKLDFIHQVVSATAVKNDRAGG